MKVVKYNLDSFKIDEQITNCVKCRILEEFPELEDLNESDLLEQFSYFLLTR